MINNAGSVGNTQDSSYQCGHSDVAHSEPLRENAAKTDLASLITAYPLAEALRDILPWAEQAIGEEGDIQENVEWLDAQKALTQAEALIKKSEAVWAVVEAARELNEKIHRTKWHLNWGENRDRAEEQLREAIEALEMMEGGE